MNPIIQHCWTPEDHARYGIRGMEGSNMVSIIVVIAVIGEAPEEMADR